MVLEAGMSVTSRCRACLVLPRVETWPAGQVAADGLGISRTARLVSDSVEHRTAGACSTASRKGRGVLHVDGGSGWPRRRCSRDALSGHGDELGMNP